MHRISPEIKFWTDTSALCSIVTTRDVSLQLSQSQCGLLASVSWEDVLLKSWLVRLKHSYHLEKLLTQNIYGFYCTCDLCFGRRSTTAVARASSSWPSFRVSTVSRLESRCVCLSIWYSRSIRIMEYLWKMIKIQDKTVLELTTQQLVSVIMISQPGFKSCSSRPPTPWAYSSCGGGLGIRILID